METGVLERARALEADRDYVGLARLMERLPATELLAEPELAYLLADARRRAGDRRGALELARALLPACQRRGNDRLYRRRSNLEAICLFELGELDGAEAEWGRLLDAATVAGDDALVARASQNLGIVLTVTGRREEAVVMHERAIAAHQRLGDARGLAQAHNNLAIAYRDLGLFAEADRAFRRAMAHAQADRSDDELGRIEQEWSLLLAARGEVAVAEVTAMRSLGRFRLLGQAVGAADTMRVLGIIALWDGRPLEARVRLGQALLRARELHARLLEAETLAALACVAHLEGDPAAYRRDEALAGAIFEELSAVAWGRRVREQLLEQLPLPA